MKADVTKETRAILDARTARLKAWILEKYDDVQADFIADTDPPIGQSELSQLYGGKPMGEKRALALEMQAGMPEGYLVRPLDDQEAKPASARIRDLQGDILYLRVVLNAVLGSLATTIPTAADLAVEIVKKTDGYRFGYAAEAIRTIRKARRLQAEGTLSALSPPKLSVVKRIPKQ